MKLTHAVLIAGSLIALTSLVDTYTAKVDARCDTFYKAMPPDLTFNIMMELNNPKVPYAFHEGYERMHGITMAQCASRIK